jgi:acyl carrier protein
MEELELRRCLRQWIVNRSKKKVNPHELRDDTPLVEQGILSSLDVTAFVLYIESLRGEEVDPDDLEPEVFENVETIWAKFFAPKAA